jgi:membrane protease YdiL (CAAX protease family)
MDITVAMGFLVASMTAMLAIYLFRSWLRQDARLYTDLPLMFGVISFAQAINMLLQNLPRGGWVEPTLELFKIRAFVIAGTAVPLLGVVLHIWLHKYQKYHIRAMILTATYWLVTTILAPSEMVIMILHIPILLTLMLAMLVTFVITWRTGRLNEVRSDVLVLALVIGVIGQGIKAPLTAMGLEIVPDILSMVMMTLATIGLSNPWFKMSKSRDERPPSKMAQESTTDETNQLSPLAAMNLLPLAVGLLSLAVLFRIIDVFVLDLGNTWIDILPSKVIPLAIILTVFWRYRPTEIRSVLGISDNNLREHVLLGIFIFAVLFFVIDVGAVLIYAAVLDSSYPLSLNLLHLELAPYLLFFFLVNGIMEEILFRGVLQQGMKTRFTANVSIAISALIFGLWHACWVLVTGEIISGVALVVFSGVLGGFFGVYYEKFSAGKSLMAPIIAHTLFNFFNETVKVGTLQGTQGPDVYTNPTVLIIGMLLFLAVFPLMFVGATRYRVEDVENFLERLRRKVTSPEPAERTDPPLAAPLITHSTGESSGSVMS